MMIPSNLGNGDDNEKHHQQIIQSTSMLSSSYNFLPSVFGNAQLDAPLFRPPDTNLGAMYLSQLAAAAAAAAATTQNQGQNGNNDTTAANEQQEETINGNNKTEIAASTSSEMATSSCGAESPMSPKQFGSVDQEVESAKERNSMDNVDSSPKKVNTDDITLTENENLQPSASELQQLDLSKWISDFFPGFPNTVPPMNVAALTQRMPPMLEQMHLMSQYFSPGSFEDYIRILAALGSASGSAGMVPSANCNPGSILNSPFASSAGISKDTYCERCDKNFCNRYFLRTHKWKKHGVPFPDKNSPSESNVTSLASPTASQNLPLDLPTTSTGVNFNAAEIFAALCNQNMLEASQISPTKTSPSQSTSVIVNCLSNTDSSPAKRARMTDEGSKDDDELVGSVRSESVRIDEEALASVASQLPNTDDLFAMIARQAQENAIAQELLSAFKVDAMQSQQQTSPVKHSSVSKEACEMCGQECESRASLQQHLLLQHNILNSFLNSFNLFSPFGPLGQHSQQQLQKQQDNQSSDADRSRNSAVLPGLIPSPISVSRQPKKQYTATGKNYCDVCNKEVCNKYFLRTHMLKMHGIVIDEHKTVIANIDTLEKEKSGTIAFRCDICNTNVGQTRESLKQHKQEVHNVVSLPTSRGHRGSLSSTSSITSTSTLSQAPKTADQSENIDQMQCPVCEIRSIGMVAMQKHLSEKHKMDMSLESLEIFLKDAYEIKTGQNAAVIDGSRATNLQQQMAERGEFTCMHCADVFSDQIQFQLHMIHSHPINRSPETGSPAAASHNVEPLCTQYSFQFSNMADSWADSEARSANISTKSMKEDEESEQKTEKIQKFFNCPMSWCARRYRNREMLKKHVSVVHHWRLKFSPRDGKNKSAAVIKSRKLWKKRYICLFEDCKHRFWSRADCEKHYLCHTESQTNNKKGLKELVVNGATENGRSQDVSKLADVREGKITLNVENGSNRKEHERNTHTINSPDLDAIPEGYGQLSTSRKPYTVQTFLVREQTSQSSFSPNGSTTPEGVVFDEMVAHLPVRNTVQEMVRVNVELVPVPMQISPILHV